MNTAAVSQPLRGPDAQQQRFAQLAWNFNCHIASMAHPTWLRYPQQASDIEWSAHLLAKYGLRDLQDWRMTDAARRVWLADASTLQALVHAIWGLVCKTRLARTVSRERRDDLRKRWNPDTWLAAIEASAPKLNESDLNFDASRHESAERVCARVLLGLVGPGCPAVSQRAHLRLPYEWRNDEPTYLLPDLRCNLVNWITHSWIPQRSPAWAWLF